MQKLSPIIGEENCLGRAISPSESVIREIVDEHLSELEFRIAQTRRAHSNSLISLETIARGSEYLLLAHLDALVVASPKVVSQLAEEFLADPDQLVDADPERVTALVLALARCECYDAIDPFLKLPKPEMRSAAAQGCIMACNSQLDNRILAHTMRAQPSDNVGAYLEVLGMRGLAPSNLQIWLMSISTEIIEPAILCLRNTKTQSLSVLQRLIESTKMVMERALMVALAWGERFAWQSCEERALDRKQVFPFAMTAYALLGGPQEHEKLAQLLSLESHRISAIRALGFSGNSAMVPLLIEQLRSKKLLEEKCAMQSICAITGLDLNNDAFCLAQPKEEPNDTSDEALPPLEEDDLDADLVPSPESDLPIPNAPAIEQWWKEKSQKMSSAQRHIWGMPFKPESLFHALESGPLGLRHEWALALAFRTNGELWLDTRTYSMVQRRKIAEARTGWTRFSPNIFSRQF